jgi:hypothetical protein
VAATPEEVDAVVSAVYAGGHAAVGWDIEWRVTFQAGAKPERASLMQIALPGGGAAGGAPVVYLLQLAHTGVTAALQRLLEDAGVAKAGVCAHNDAHKVTRDFGLTPAGVVDCSELAARRLFPPQRWSLAALVSRLLARQLPKPQGLRTGAWDARTLSREQMEYAALDAWASLRVHAALMQLPLLPVAPPPSLPPPAHAGATSGGWVPAVAEPAQLAPCKRDAHAQHCAGATAAQIAAARGIKVITVENYLCDAMCVSACLPACMCEC